MVTTVNNTLNNLLLTTRPGNSIESLLKVGHILTADIKPLSNTQVQLTIGNQTLLATTKTPIQETGTVQVKVNQVTPELQLSIVKNPAPNSLNNLSQTVQSAYRQFVPLQSPISQVFQQINLLQSLPPSVQTSVQELMSLTSKNQLQPDGQWIKQKLIESGLFLESKLKQSKPGDMTSFKNDIKAQILQLQQQVSAIQQQNNSSSLTKLSTLLDQALSRITVQQVQLFENPNITPLEIPFERNKRIHNDSVEIRKHEQADKAKWEAYIDLTLPQGLLSVKLNLNNDNQLDCFVWGETEELKENVEQHMDLLKQLLQIEGVELNTIQLALNKPPKTDKSTKMALIDIKI
ncbi:flagellar hook-length control protein FliK [Thiomicrorhabdus sp.]|uniref:flagellar hook-length control protein FliK n=1 Tax=Thiomicrorhabdus sp. TaxID=2039724 RepID=UPI002AA7BB7E|nr:flagellar hook-length control protein FliK [Thiomicrorhabdus sp.]